MNLNKALISSFVYEQAFRDRWSLLDDYLKAFKMEYTRVDTLLALLEYTLPYKDKLQYRDKFLHEVRSELYARGTLVEELLKDL